MNDPTEILRRVQTVWPDCQLSGRQIVGSLYQDCDYGQPFIESRNYYVWYYLLGKVLRPRTIVEMGTRFGYSLRALTLGAGHDKKEFSLHVWDDQRDGIDSLTIFENHFRQAGFIDLNIHKVDTQSITTLGVRNADLAHVDAWHTEDGCYQECKLAYNAVRPGGVILVDDTNPGCVRTGCERFCKDHSLPYVFAPSLMGMHIIGVHLDK